MSGALESTRSLAAALSSGWRAFFNKKKEVGKGEGACAPAENQTPQLGTPRRYLGEIGGRSLLEIEGGGRRTILHCLIDLGELASANMLAQWAGCNDMFEAVKEEVDREWALREMEGADVLEESESDDLSDAMRLTSGR